jgi:hypothetical protein
MSSRPSDDFHLADSDQNTFSSENLANRLPRHLWAFVLVTLAILFSRAADHFLGSSAFLVVGASLVAVALSCGLYASLLYVLFAAAGTDFFLLPPLGEFSLDARTIAITGWYAIAAASAFGFDRMFQKRQKSTPTARPDLAVQAENTSEFIGFVDVVEDGEVQGWAFEPERPETPTLVKVFVNDVAVAEARAVYHRPDVAEHLNSSGLQAFYVDLSKCIDPQVDALVDVRFMNGQSLAGSPLIASIPPRRISQHPAILFMHLAKTAGTAFRDAIFPNYKQSEIAYLYPDPPGFPNFCSLLEIPTEQRARLRFMMGHFIFGIHNLLPQESCYITVIRNPVDRVLSHYLFLSGTQPELLTDGSRHLTLPEVLERKLIVDLDNQMVRCFAGANDSTNPAGTIDKSVYDLAINNLHTYFAYVGHQERSAACYKAMQEKFGWWATPELSLVNKTERALPDQLYKSTIPAIESHNRWDLMLYQEILKLFPL